MEESFDILHSFGALFFLLLACFLLLLAAASLLLRGRSEKTRVTVLVTACLITFVGFFVYKYFLSVDADYNRILTDQYVKELTDAGTDPAEAVWLAAGKAGFNWWNELPFHLCNVNMILIPVGVLFKKRSILGFCFFAAPLGALFALLLPAAGFDGYSIFLPRMLGYYFTHYMIVIEGLAIATFGFYRPKFRDLPMNMLATACLSLGAFLISTLIRAARLSLDANYFFTYYHENISLLKLFYSLIPVPYLYLLPALLILAAYMGLVMGGFWLAGRGADKKNPGEGKEAV